MGKKRVVILFGGRADEHSISCISAATLLRTIDTARYDPVPVGITKAGEWILPDEDPREWDLESGQMPEVVAGPDSVRVLLDVSAGRDGFSVRRACGTIESLGHLDVVFPVFHGPFGEDGTIQGMLEMLDIPYVGCGVLASAASMDKHFTKILLTAAGVPVAPGITVDTRGLETAADFEENAGAFASRVAAAGLMYPLFVKPSRAGSSFGVSKIESSEGLAAALFEASQHDWRVLIEQGVDGREMECAVMSTSSRQKPRTAWPGEIVMDTPEDAAFYDFDSKYVDEQASHIEVPAKLPMEVLERVRELAATAFMAVDGRGLARVDTFVLPTGQVMVNEINTMPGFTSISMFPRAWEASGLPFEKVITELIESVS